MTLRHILAFLTVALWVCNSAFAEPPQPDNTLPVAFPAKITLRNGWIIRFDPTYLTRLKKIEKPEIEEKSPITSRTIGNDNFVAIAAAKQRGSATALSDIKAGKLRILVSVDDLICTDVTPLSWFLATKPFPFVDGFTGFPVQIVGIELVTQGCSVSKAFVAEVEAYNRVMYSWSKAKIMEDPK